MDEKFLNIIGKLSVEINEIKDELKNKADNGGCLQLIEDIENKVLALDSKLSKLEKDIQQIVLASNSFMEKVNTLDSEWQENRELIISERQRRAKLSSSIRKNCGYKILDDVGFSGRLRALRRKNKMYVSDVSKRTLVPETTLSSIENFKLRYINKDYLKSLNDFFDYDFSEYVEKEEKGGITNG